MCSRSASQNSRSYLKGVTYHSGQDTVLRAGFTRQPDMVVISNVVLASGATQHGTHRASPMRRASAWILAIKLDKSTRRYQSTIRLVQNSTILLRYLPTHTLLLCDSTTILRVYNSTTLRQYSSTTVPIYYTITLPIDCSTTLLFLLLDHSTTVLRCDSWNALSPFPSALA